MKILRCLLLSSCLACSANPAARAAAPLQRTELSSDHGEIWTVGTETRALYTGSVTLTGTNLRILCDRLEVVAEGVDDKTSTVPVIQKFKHLLATGHVRIVQGDREATCGRAEVLPREDKVVLTENPVVIDHGSELVTAGEKITLLRGERRVSVDNPRTTAPSIQDLGFDKDKPLETPAAPSK
jgi:lipopolysaccharide export system protein LptA